tara:strand:- start:787 stop:1152 length:366 start_codon:yes stop_codon:yes gene_type:complete
MNKTALLLIDHGSKKKAANDMINDIVNLIILKKPHVIVVGAHMELASPTIEDGINECIKQGAKNIIAQPFMLSPGRHTTEDIPQMVAKIAKNFPDINISTSSHLGVHPLLVDIILERAGIE